ncbi:MAG TPA: hypothetical protein VLE19_13870, partial [Pyrinomonadaceae bacterium]|nr:hypothetical protein [Pyrinomonadaceae bacterium]
GLEQDIQQVGVRSREFPDRIFRLGVAYPPRGLVVIGLLPLPGPVGLRQTLTSLVPLKGV